MTFMQATAEKDRKTEKIIKNHAGRGEEWDRQLQILLINEVLMPLHPVGVLLLHWQELWGFR